MLLIKKYQNLFSDYLKSSLPESPPDNLYNPASYILKLGGKRIRPILTLISAEVFGGSINDALPAALGIEVFHNFSLIHDDIMDKAPLRRGKKTVHEKWDVNTAILSGDVMLIWSYELFQKYSPDISFLLNVIFTKTARKVCEGQQMDMDFPNQEDISIDDYMLMIEYKTAALIGCALSVGAIISGAKNEQVNLIYDIGLELGLVFQLQDDYLDVFGDRKKTGKQIGGDIIENKKTFLHLYAKTKSSNELKKELKKWTALSPKDPEKKISAIKSIYNSSGAVKAVQKKIELLSKTSINKIKSLKLAQSKEIILIDFVERLVERDF
ncbi:MAG: polyprenyl synthetase [Flavobacteriaceae bacterium]|nr:polyprenyl synthetase [Flavobacteriaceae bacterium]|tara:strand:+ start:1544 stop:2518 length:975 start_codon:yes stop_codon:yes gene_type:complete